MIDIEFVRISLFIITFVLGCLGATVLVKTTTDYQQVNETFIVNDERFKVNYITYPDQDNLRDKDVLQMKQY